MLLYVVCFLRLGVVCSVVGVWGVVIFVLSVMRVVGGVPLWVVCVIRPVDVVCLCLVCTQLLSEKEYSVRWSSTPNQQLRKRPNQEGTCHPRTVKIRILQTPRLL